MTKPIARREGLVVQELPDEVLVYDFERDRAHCLNETAAFVWQHRDGRSSAAQIALTLGNQFNCEVDERIVWLALDQLRRNHLLERQPALPPAMQGMNRRAMVRAFGLTASGSHSVGDVDSRANRPGSYELSTRWGFLYRQCAML
jgi:hypothetical protein